MEWHLRDRFRRLQRFCICRLQAGVRRSAYDRPAAAIQLCDGRRTVCITVAIRPSRALKGSWFSAEARRRHAVVAVFRCCNRRHPAFYRQEFCPKKRRLAKSAAPAGASGKKESKDLVIKKIRCNFATQIGVLYPEICVTLKF